MQDLHVSSDSHTYSMKLTHLVGSSDDLENIALVRIFLGRVRDRSADFVYGQPGAEFLPMHPVMEEEIGYYTELQEEWDSILPLYNHALAIHQGRLTRPYTQLTSPANITTQAPATTVTFSPSRDSWNWDAEVDELINEERMKCKMNETGVNAKQEESLTDSPVLKHDD
jgi:hypothetical protein